MYVQELKDRVAHEDYVVDPQAVAAAIWLRWKATHLTGRATAARRCEDGPAGPAASGEVVEPE